MQLGKAQVFLGGKFFYSKVKVGVSQLLWMSIGGSFSGFRSGINIPENVRKKSKEQFQRRKKYCQELGLRNFLHLGIFFLRKKNSANKFLKDMFQEYIFQEVIGIFIPGSAKNPGKNIPEVSLQELLLLHLSSWSVQGLHFHQDSIPAKLFFQEFTLLEFQGPFIPPGIYIPGVSDNLRNKYSWDQNHIIAKEARNTTSASRLCL